MSDEQKPESKSEKMKGVWAKRKAEADQKKAAAEVAPPEIMPAMPDEDGAGLAPEVLDPVERAPVAATPFEVFLASLSEETRELLSEAELRAAFAAAEQQAKEERRTQLKKAATEKARHHARATAGLLPAEKLAQLALQEQMNRRVRWTVQMPFVSDTGGIADEGLLIDGRRLYHGQEVETTFGEWRSALSMIYNLRQHELDFEGKGRLHHLRRMVEARGYDVHGVRQ